MLRASAYVAIDGTRPAQSAEASASDLRLIHPNQDLLSLREMDEGRLLLNLTAELLKSMNMQQTLSVFEREAHLHPNGPILSEEDEITAEKERLSWFSSVREEGAQVLGLDAHATGPLLLQLMRRHQQHVVSRLHQGRGEEKEVLDGTVHRDIQQSPAQIAAVERGNGGENVNQGADEDTTHAEGEMADRNR